MSRNQRLALVVAALVVAVIAFVIASPGDDDDGNSDSTNAVETAPARNDEPSDGTSGTTDRPRRPSPRPPSPASASSAARCRAASSRSRSPRATGCASWSPPTRPTRCTCTATTSRRRRARQAGRLRLHREPRGRLRAREPHRRGRRPRAGGGAARRWSRRDAVRARARHPRRPADPRVAVRLGGGDGAGDLVRRAGGALARAAPAARALAPPVRRAPADLAPGRGGLRRDRDLPASASSSTAACKGTEAATANFAPTFIYVIFWVGLVFASVLFGDVFRAFNPWRALGRAVAWVGKTAAREDLPAPLEYPERLRPLAGGGRARRVHVAGARLLEQRQPRAPRDRGADLLGGHVRRDGALRRRRLVRSRRGVRRLLQPLLAHLGVRGPRPGDRAASLPLRAAGPDRAAGHGRAACRDDRLDDLRRRRRGGAVDEHLAEADRVLHRQRRALAAARARGDVRDRLRRGDRDRVRLLLARRDGCAQRRRGLHHGRSGEGRSLTRWCRSRSPTSARTI